MIEERLKHLEMNIAHLRGMLSLIESDSFEKDIEKQWALRYGLFESIQIVIDISCHLVSKHNLGSRKNYRDCIDALESFNYLSTPLANTIRQMIGLRNILIHEYVKIDILKLRDFLSHLSDFDDFSQAVAPHV
jgi:uncharacterized protein YutE (UPF0331/DUF86 family)